MSAPARARGAPIRSISAVLPAHNEAASLLTVVGETLDALLDVVPSFEVIIVDDGSNDGTRRIAEELAANHREVKVLHSAQRRGYGVAWREGLAAATKQYAVFIDPNRCYSPADLDRLVKWDDSYDIVAGFRARGGEPATRRLGGYLFRIVTRLLFDLKLRDVNCGFKLVRMSLLRELDLQATTGAVHTELMCRASQYGATVREVAVRYAPRAPADSILFRLRRFARTARELSSLRAVLVREKRQAALDTRGVDRKELTAASRPANPNGTSARRDLDLPSAEPVEQILPVQSSLEEQQSGPGVTDGSERAASSGNLPGEASGPDRDHGSDAEQDRAQSEPGGLDKRGPEQSLD